MYKSLERKKKAAPEGKLMRRYERQIGEFL